MPMKGMDVELVSEFGNRLKSQVSTNVNDLRSTVVTRGQTLAWEGADARVFMDERLESLSAEMMKVAELIVELGQIAINNANAQADVSAHL